MPLGDGEYWVPRRFDLIITNTPDSLGWRMSFVVRDGVPICQKIIIESHGRDREVQSSDLRALRIEDMVEWATKYVAKPVKLDDHGKMCVLPITLEEVHNGVTLPAVRAARRRVRRKVTPSVLREVAQIYRSNLGGSPTAAVQRHFDLGSERTARLWVKKSRDEGYLGKSLRGRGGEQ